MFFANFGILLFFLSFLAKFWLGFKLCLPIQHHTVYGVHCLIRQRVGVIPLISYGCPPATCKRPAVTFSKPKRMVCGTQVSESDSDIAVSRTVRNLFPKGSRLKFNLSSRILARERWRRILWTIPSKLALVWIRFRSFSINETILPSKWTLLSARAICADRARVRDNCSEGGLSRRERLAVPDHNGNHQLKKFWSDFRMT